MKDIYSHIADRLKPLKRSDNINTIEVWNNQISLDNEEKENHIRYNAIFIAFQVNETKNFSFNIKERNLGVRFYFGLKNYSSRKDKYLNFYQRFTTLIDGWGYGGDSSRPLADQPPIFSPLRESQLEFDEDQSLIAIPFMDYTTIYKDFSSYTGVKKNRVAQLTGVQVQSIEVTNDI